jgi:conjugal transfer/entry exclusion protein
MVRTVEDIEKAITQLPQNQLQQFRVWYEKFDIDAWDEQIEKDVAAGKLDALAEASIADHKAGKSREI